MPPAPPADIAAPSVRHLLREAEARGVDGDAWPPWLRDGEVDLTDPDARVALDRYLDLAASLARLADDPALPHRAVRTGGPERFHLLGFVAMTQPDLRTAVDAICAHLEMWIRGIRLVCAHDNGLVAHVEVDAERVPARRRLLETLALSSLQAHIEQLPQTKVRVSVRLPDDVEEAVVASFGPEVTRGEPTALILDAEEAARPLRLAQPEMAAFFRARADEQRDAQQVEERVIVGVRDELTARLPHGDLRQEAIAEALGTSVRTLQRELDEAGTTFQEVLDAVRRQLAIRHLDAQPTLPIDTVGWLVGYRDPASFRRAFRRWMSMSPAEYRRTLH